MNFKVISKDEIMEILGEDYKSLQWGYLFPAAAHTGVSARMILDRYCLSYLGDRCSWMGNDKDLDKKTADKCVEIRLAEKLHQFMNDNGITSSSDDTILGEIDGYRMLATPRASFGYVYMSFWAV